MARKSLYTSALIAALSTAFLLSGCTAKSEFPEAEKIKINNPSVAFDLLATINAQNASLRLSPVESPRIMAYSMLAAYRGYIKFPDDLLSANIAAAVAGSEVAASLLIEENRALEVRALPTRYQMLERPAAITYGLNVAKSIIENAKKSGYEESRKLWDPESSQGTTRYIWEPTGRGEPGFEPGWGQINPIIKASSNCTLPTPDDQEVLNQVTMLLNNFDQRSAVGSDVMWWLAGPGTPTPSGQFLRIVANAVKNEELSDKDALKLFTISSIAAYDAGIMGWREKYRHNLARPETIWRKIPGVLPPTLPRETPNHPSYPSGHSLFTSAIAEVAINLVGDIPSFDKLPADLYVPAETRSWPSLSAAYQEAGRSRVNAGFHTQLDVDAGVKLGKCVATAALANFDDLIEEQTK